MNELLNNYWIELLELIFLPIQSTIGFSPLIGFIVLALFLILQFFLLWTIFVKPFVYFIKTLLGCNKLIKK